MEMAWVVWSKKNFVNYGNILLSAKMLIEMREIECTLFAMKTSVFTDLRHNQVNFFYFNFIWTRDYSFFNKNKRNKTYAHLCRILIKKTWDNIFFGDEAINKLPLYFDFWIHFFFSVRKILRECNLVLNYSEIDVTEVM